MIINQRKANIMAKTHVTILNSMAGTDFEKALDKHVLWDIKVLDLRDAIFGKSISDLTKEDAIRANDLIVARDLSVYCFSTSLFAGNIESGEREFRENHLGKIDHVIEIAKILKPKMIRLLSAQTSKRAEITDSTEYIRKNHPWLVKLYAEAIDRFYDVGFKVTIENEIGNTIFSKPAEIVSFFDELNRSGKACLTWDVQNLWQMGIFPTMEVYNELKHLIGYCHLKGGQQESGSTRLLWASSLEDASWSVAEITRQVVADGISPIICLNPSHGKAKEGYDYSDIVRRDLQFARKIISL